jgi:CubicO group peptidase (beta-lactamase class C family)
LTGACAGRDDPRCAEGNPPTWSIEVLGSRMRRLALLASVLAVVCAIPARADDLDDFVNAAIQRRNISGVAIAVVKDGVLVRSGGYGLADRERGIAPGPDTVFLIGSLSKQFIATGVMLLVQDGKLAVGDRLAA